jgi:hypothetical protein
MNVRALLLLVLVALTACGEKTPAASESPACTGGLTNIKEGWNGLETRIAASLGSTSWCFRDPAELRAALGRAVTELERLKRDQPASTQLATITDQAWLDALAAVRTVRERELALAGEIECPDTAMLLAFRTSQQIVDATAANAAPALTLLDEQQRPVQMPWTPTVLLLAITDAPGRIDAMVRSSAVQRDRSARLRQQVQALSRALASNPSSAKPALDAVDDSLVPILHEQIGQAKTTTNAWLTQCGGVRPR